MVLRHAFLLYGHSENMSKDQKAGTLGHPVFVLNMSYAGLGVARNLASKGVSVIGLTSEPGSAGALTRFCKAIHQTPNGRDEPEALCQRLLELAEIQRQPIVIFPTRDFDIFFLEAFRSKLEPAFILPQPPIEVINRVMDKFVLADIASRAGIAVPWTRHYQNARDLAADLDHIALPVVIKPRFAYQWRRKGTWEKIGARKAVIVYTRQMLKEELDQIFIVDQDILLQEFIPGDDRDISLCCCYMSRQLEMLGCFTARKLIQSPALFGTGCLVEARSIPELIPLTEKLLRACEYSGLAEVEFKFNAKTGKYSLIEVNARHWDQHELGTRLGVNLSWIAYNDVALGRQVSTKPDYRLRFSWVAERELLLEALKRILRQRRIPRELATFFKTKHVFGICKLSDPKPCFRLLTNMILEVISIFGSLVLQKFRSRRNT